MEEAKTLIEQLSTQLKNSSLQEALSKTIQELKDNEMAHRTRTEAIEDSINQVRRKNKNAESELERLHLLQTKNAAAFNKKNTERIKLSRKIIELEQENEELGATISETLEKITNLENEVKVLSYPTVEELYYEIVRGFGVDFIEKDERLCARIKNKSKNDVFLIDCDKNAVQETCEKIWKCIEF